jgi:hypothetical protein
MECSAYAYGGFDGNVPDPENVLYCDPLYMDTPALDSPDDDFVVFQYNILNRYSLLDRMKEESKNRAMICTQGDIINTGQDWRNMDNPRDAQANTIQDHYGRSYFAPATQTPGNKRRRI